MANLYYIDNNGVPHQLPAFDGVYSVNGMNGAVEVPVPVKGVQVNGTDITPDADGKVNVPMATISAPGVVKAASNAYNWTGLKLSDGVLHTISPSNTWIDSRVEGGAPISIATLDHAVKAAMTDGKGAAWTAAEQAAARKRMGLGGDYELIASITVEQDTDVVEISSIDSTAVILLVEYSGSASGSIGTLFMHDNKNICYCFRHVTPDNSYLYARCELQHGMWNAIYSSPQGIYQTPAVWMDAPDSYRRGHDSTFAPHINKVRIYKNNSGGVQLTAGTVIKVYGVRI